MATNEVRKESTFPTSAGVFLGLGLGGFFDGIIFQQTLQWHSALTSSSYPTTGAAYPITSMESLGINTLWDSTFHMSTYVFVIVGLVLLWQTSLRARLYWSGRLLAGALLMGFGIFNLVEGLLNHHLLGLHHFNETVPHSQWIFWDMAYLLWGAAMLVGGWFLYKSDARKLQPVAINS